MKWQYEVHIQAITDPVLDQYSLDKWGRDGWELVAVYDDGLNVHYFFKRVLSDPPTVS